MQADCRGATATMPQSRTTHTRFTARYGGLSSGQCTLMHHWMDKALEFRADQGSLAELLLCYLTLVRHLGQKHRKHRPR